MHWALWKKSIREARWLLLGGAVTMFGFQWLRVWVVGQLPMGNFRALLRLMPPFAAQLSPIPFDQLATSLGRIAAGFTEPLVVLIVTVWSIARGSDAVSGELGRGTMEILLAQPVRRVAVLWTQAAVTIGGAAVLALSACLGVVTGLATVRLEEPVAVAALLPAVLNLFALGAFLAGAATLASSADRYRTRTIGVVGGLYVLATVLKIIGRVNDRWHWLVYGSFLTAFEPALLVMQRSNAWTFWHEGPDGTSVFGGASYSGILLVMAIICYAIATAIFCRRDLPAPL